jgi:uncharacterized membrane protein YwaF
VLVVMLGRRLRDSGAEVVFSRAFAAVLTTYTVTMLVYRSVPGNFDVHISLPVHLSDLNPQAILTPALDSPDFPHIDFIDLWVQHILVLWATLYLIWGRGGRVDWGSYRLAMVVTVTWAMAAFGLNRWLGTNYGFLNGKPDNPSILDLLGPWPWYLLVEFLVIAVAWALITWPWTVRRPSTAETRGGAAG